MTRRYFIQNTVLSAAGLWITEAIDKKSAVSKNPRRRTPRLSPGATIALIAPAGPLSDERLQQALTNLSTLGYSVREGTALRHRKGYLAGEDADRLRDLHWAFADAAIDAVWCGRGGYGATRILPRVDFRLIARNPKPFIGYSDITALHIAIGQKAGLVTFHAPGASALLPPDTLQYLQAVLVEPQVPYTLTASPFAIDPPPMTISPGKASGVLIGGNLTLLTALVGTPFQPSFRGKIVFIEDIGEQPYRIDRMFTQLLQATDLRKAAGIALGTFIDCGPKTGDFSFSLAETLHFCLGNLGMPIAYGLPFGHMNNQATLPYGIRAELDADKISLTLLEPACI
ncbi:MAG: LD-carboxypeptidase [Saprospiraceae bacterium]|nr:LD-carboxypeptidase [Saprospiraceae bacterium]MDW8483489.1 LD-carboxypeptidase [Saprospiraceae bacterium]